MTNKRDEFSPTTKRIMAERVAWRCSFPNCNIITVGPNSHDIEKRINLGDAAHIIAASSKGPRADSSIDPKQRKHISNGIWMCKPHATLIDADFKEYSVETLRLWKVDAERIAAENLKALNNQYIDDSSTLLQIGTEIIFYACWKSVSANTWTFKLLNPLIGNIDKIKEYVEAFDRLVETEHYVVIESQGDARIISYPPKLEKQDYETFLSLTVKNPHKSTDPRGIGCDLALGKDGDLLVNASGNIAMTSGIDTAIQSISTCLSTSKGECYFAPEVGSVINNYYKQYRNDLKLLSRLFKLELIRLSLIPIGDSINKNSSPHLPFIKRISNVNIENITLVNQRFDIEVNVIWGNDEHWTGNIWVFVNV
jgi:hypothetical protein